LLSTRSRRAIRKRQGRFGKPYMYSPRGNLLERLSTKLNISKSEAYNQLMKEREFLLENKAG